MGKMGKSYDTSMRVFGRGGGWIIPGGPIWRDFIDVFRN